MSYQSIMNNTKDRTKCFVFNSKCSVSRRAFKERHEMTQDLLTHPYLYKRVSIPVFKRKLSLRTEPHGAVLTTEDSK